MSSAKRQSLLSSYFGDGPKTPTVKTPKGPAEVENKTELGVAGPLKRINIHGDSPVKSSAKKKRKVLLSSDEEDDAKDAVLDDDRSTTKPCEPVTPSTKLRTTVSTPKSLSRPMSTSTPRSAMRKTISTEEATSFIDSFRAEDENLDDTLASVATLDRTEYKMDVGGSEEPMKLLKENGTYAHEGFEWLKPEKIRDANRRRPTEEDYDCTTLFVPQNFMNDQTPGHKQWWTLKAANYDTILFFKVGKFYEMYHMDAVVAVEALSLAYMKGNYAHCGFPEASYGKYADQLVSRGYKVARVEQTETPQQLEDRNASRCGAKDKVVARELCRVTTLGTRTFGVLDGVDGAGSESADASSRFLLAIKQNYSVESTTCVYGICFVDTAVGRFFIGEFEDDDYRSQLRTLLANRMPVQVLTERGGICGLTRAILSSMLGAVPKEALSPKKDFLTPQDTIAMLCQSEYLGSEAEKWPVALRSLLREDSVLPAAHNNSLLVWSSIGAVVKYLKRCLIDVDMVTMRLFHNYNPKADTSLQKMDCASSDCMWKGRQMVIDGVSLYNLNLVDGDVGDTAAAQFSLYNTINKCHTPFGRRLLRQWVCAPTCDPDTLRSRQDTIDWLMSSQGSAFADRVSELLRKLPDLERLMQKVHTLGLKYRAEKHPDSRAVMFDTDRYNKRKIKDLVSVITGFEVCGSVFDEYLRTKESTDSVACALLDEWLSIPVSEELNDNIVNIKGLFNPDDAERHGTIVPIRGCNMDYDAACDEVKDCEAAIQDYRRVQIKKLNCAITYWGTGKNRFQMEIRDTETLSTRYELKSRKKGFCRYMTAELANLITALGKAEQNRARETADATRRVFAAFDEKSSTWNEVVKRLSALDVLLSLARFAQTSGLEMCRPEFVFNVDKPLLDIRNGCHPSLALNLPSSNLTTTTSYIANDTVLGGVDGTALTMLLTGPNMGGKSTLMRQTAVLCVLAHIGSWVPARSMRLSPVDRIFTRIGANDRIMCGQSTFFVELNETRLILQEATPHSLVLMDELGRGTSTFDGTAIATAVLRAVSEQVGCRCFFSTHYHSICDSVNAEKVMLAHMACMVENENTTDPTEESVTFLYQLAPGICPKSYGFYAAKLAGVDEAVVRQAYEASGKMARRRGDLDAATRERLRVAAAAGTDIEELRTMVEAL